MREGGTVGREGGEGGREGREGGREGGGEGRGGEGKGGRGGREGGRETRGPGNYQCQAWLCTEACQTVVVSIHSALTCCREGLRAVRWGIGRAREGGMDQLLLFGR